jgi:PIN domain nuclease of toxin-antitoxin system
MLNLDTHMIVHMLNGDLTPDEHRKMEQAELAFSDISLWELVKLVALGRLSLDLEGPEFRRLLSVAVVIPLTIEIAIRSTRLDFSSDPADEIIAATSLVYDIPLMTRDKRIRKSKIVPFA